MTNKIWKRTLTLAAAAILALAFSLTCFAAENEKLLASYTEDLGNGITAVVTITETESFARATKRQSMSKKYYTGGTYIGVAVLTASFSYDGSTSRAVEAVGSGSGANGWSYSGQSTRTSGKTAYLTASFKKSGKTVPVSLSLTCDANGNVS